MRALLIFVVAMVTLGYPVIVYFGVQRVSPAFFALLLLVVAAVKFAIAKDKKDFYQLAILAVAIVFSILLAVTNNQLMLRLYPVIMSISVAWIFASSLREPENMLLRMARMAGKTITPEAQFYTRRLTLLWVLLLLANAVVALYFALFGTLAQWAFYCGFLSYILIGLVFILELIYRHFYIARHQRRALTVTESNNEI